MVNEEMEGIDHLRRWFYDEFVVVEGRALSGLLNHHRQCTRSPFEDMCLVPLTYVKGIF